MNKEVDVFPRMLTVNVEYVGKFGWTCRTLRSSIKRETGADGIWMPVAVPKSLPTKEALDEMLREEQ
jgi:hypothetical protein